MIKRTYFYAARQEIIGGEFKEVAGTMTIRSWLPRSGERIYNIALAALKRDDFQDCNFIVTALNRLK